MRVSDKLSQEKANLLVQLYTIVCTNDLEIRLSKSQITIVMPCGSEMTKEFNPIGCKHSAYSVIYSELVAIKTIMREIEEKI